MKVRNTLLITAATALLLSACSSETSGSFTDYSGQTLVGEVTALDGDLMALSLGTYDEDAVVSMDDFDPGSMQMPDMPQDTGQNPDQTGDSADNSSSGSATDDASGTREGMTEPENGTVPDKPDGDAQDGTVPDKPDGETGIDVPDQPDGETGNSDGSDPSGNGTAPAGDMQMPDQNIGGGMMMQEFSNGFTADGTSAIFSYEGATVESGESADTQEDSTASDSSESTDTSSDSEESVSLKTGDIVSVVMGSDNKAESITILYSAREMEDMAGQSTSGTSTNSAFTITEDGSYVAAEYSSSQADQNALLIDGATVTLDQISVDKSGGESSNTENGDFYGVNAALLAENGANVTIQNSTVTSNAQNGNGIFSYGEGTTVTVSDTTITTQQDNSGGIQTTGGGTTIASNLTIETNGSSSAAIRSDRGGGTVQVEDGTYTTNGYNSPAVYSTADITVKNAQLTANNSEALVIEGENSITLENCEVSGNMSDDKGTSSDENVHCVMVYQSMSGDAEEGTSSLSITGGTLTCKNGDVFHFTNTSARCTFSGVEIVNEETDGYLISITGNDASKGWGTAGKNGAQVDLSVSKQSLEGDIVVDTISTLNLTMKDGSELTGTVNIIDNEEGGSAVENNAVLVIEEGCTWTLTGDCTVTSLENKGTINYNGYTITLADGTVLSE